MQRIIFLDIDGVLNSLSFYKRNKDKQVQLDPDTLKLLKTLVDESGAKIVLTSSWRGGWSRNEGECGEEGRILNRAFAEYGLKIMDKTGVELCLMQQTRCKEILKWLKHAYEPVGSFVILDDADYDWKKYGLDRFLVHTDFKDGGLKACHIGETLEKLKHPPVSVKWLLFWNFLKGNLRKS